MGVSGILRPFCEIATCDEERGKERGEKADNQGDSKSSNRTAVKLREDEGRDKRCEV